MSLGSQGAKAGLGGADGQGLPQSLRPRWVIKGEEASVVKKAGRGERRGDKDKRKDHCSCLKGEALWKKWARGRQALG